ncbi:Uncharacterized calcium-binding protein C800.10c [Linum perenne]
MAGQNPSVDLFDAYFKRADLDGDGQISGAEAVAFFQSSGLPKQVLAQVWMYADQRKAGYLGRQEFYNALKLVTVAQSKRDLTHDIVRAALYGPASSKIPAPQINLAATPAPKVAAPVSQFGGSTSAPSQNVGIRPTQQPAQANQQYLPSQQNQFMRPPQAMPPNSTSHQHQNFPRQGINSGTPPATRSLGSGISTDWPSGNTSAPPSQSPNQGIAPSARQDGAVFSASSMTTSIQARPLVPAGKIPSSQPQALDSDMFFKTPVANDSKSLAVSENGFNSSSSSAASVNSSALSSAMVSSTELQPSVKPTPLGSLQNNAQQLAGGQQTGKQIQPAAGHDTNPRPSGNVAVASGNVVSGQSRNLWPRMVPADIQKYLKVFLQVDTDRDGKITGEQARNLFLSWRLPREVLKQVWDLSDQDNDSMLSAKEFCVALYLMERYREGRPLPPSLPSSVVSDEALLSATSRPTASHAGGAWGPVPEPQQPQVMAGSRPMHPAAPRPPRPPSGPHAEEKPPSQPKPKVPVLEKHLVDQLTQEEQDSLNSKFQEASQADKKVEELEKEISESRQKIDFFRTKMQELILYKSRCDNRLNEVIERVAADKHEVDALAKKYEEKYKQAGDVASKLTIEEATFRDIQEKKMEIYRGIVKMDEGDTADGAIKERAERIHSSLEELVRSLNERCKQYGLRAKPMSLVELPFGWQTGIQGGAADWDEDWDKFEDEGFMFVKELTTDVQNIVAPLKPKSVRKEKAATEGSLSLSTSNADAKLEKISSAGESVPYKESIHSETENSRANSPPGSPTKGGTENQTREFQEPFKGNAARDGSPHASGLCSDVADTVSVFSGDRSVDEATWGRFDSHYDNESIWGNESVGGKEADLESHTDSSLFGMSEFNLNPIKTGTIRKSSFMFDSVPSSPAYNQGNNSYTFDSIPSTPAYNQGKSSFGFDSVPGTPAYNQGKSSFVFDSVPSTPAHSQGMTSFGYADSVPGTPSYDLGGKGPFSFADSVPGTPAYDFGNSRRLSEGFDSMRSTTESEQGYGIPSRFDSFRESGDSDVGQSFSRFDSFRESEQSHVVPSFDSFRDADNGQGFMSRFDSFRDSGDTDHGRGFTRFDSFGGHDSELIQSTGFDYEKSSKDSLKDHGFSSFDDSDPFGSSTKKSSDEWKAF